MMGAIDSVKELEAEDVDDAEQGDGPIRALWTQLVLHGAPPHNEDAYFAMVGSDIEDMIKSGEDDDAILNVLTFTPLPSKPCTDSHGFDAAPPCKALYSLVRSWCDERDSHRASGNS